MSKRSPGMLAILDGAQAQASNPRADVWLSASAGTGKTHVLASRVYRLLLDKRVKPETILCLTYTKAGAAEMAQRVHSRLAAWVRMPAKDLRKDLHALGENNDDAAVAHARTLFASVLDARGGGLRIQTIHSFCTSLLGNFPIESGLTPGFRAIEPREEGLLGDRVLGDLVIAAARDGRAWIGDALTDSVLRLGELPTRSFLAQCARGVDAMAGLPEGPGLRVILYEALCDGIRAPRDWLIARCGDSVIPRADIDDVLAANENWMTKAGTPNKQGEACAAVIHNWLALSPEARPDELTELARAWLAGTGKPYAKSPGDSGYSDSLTRVIAWHDRLCGIKRGADFADALAPILALGKVYCADYAAAKRARGLVDFDDLIRRTVALLAEPGMGDWIRYKLDQATDHILIDEAQDTNAAQWDIIDALADEFFAGDGAKANTPRTIFTVGDYKQAIFGFQGTNPVEFGKARERFVARAGAIDRHIAQLSLFESFRSSPPVLSAVDAVIDHIGPENFGLAKRDPDHRSARGGTGLVTLWRPVSEGVDSGDDNTISETDNNPEGWISESQRRFAGQLAGQIKQWIDSPFWLDRHNRWVMPQDIMVLVRSRGELAQLIVARLHGVGVAVAGLDRLRLSAPLGVQDLLACARYAVQPADDLNLAALLVSPIIGWSYDDLERVSVGRTHSLLRTIREMDCLLPALNRMLTLGDKATPYRFFETILSGEIDARRKLMAQMGPEVRDPIEELLNAARAFEGSGTPSLQAFIDWFDRGTVDIKRDPSAAENAVRVMTVHGAKGLQAPVVILADATRDPSVNRSDTVEWTMANGVTLPVFTPKANALPPPIKTAIDDAHKRESKEHWRLLYVAMTRAEERLYIGGALSKRQQAKGELSPDCWHSAVASGLGKLMPVYGEDGTTSYGSVVAPKSSSLALAAIAELPAVPDWLRMPAPTEARPPRPLAPSSLGEDDTPFLPPGPAMRSAADRGRWLHALFERLPAVAVADRAAAAQRWLERSAGIADPGLRQSLASEALGIIDDPAFASIFAPDTFAEAPIAGVVDGLVIAGTVDRLLISEREVVVIDFKTGTRVPAVPGNCPVPHLRQMSAYVALLGGIFPDRPVRAGLLYTSGPVLHMLDDHVLAANKPGFAPA